MPGNLVIRSAGCDDIERVGRVLASSWKAAYRNIVNVGYLDTVYAEQWFLFLQRGFSDKTIDCFLLETDHSGAIGVSIMRRSMIEAWPHDGELVSLYLLPDYTGRGMGRVLYAASEKSFRRHGYSHCILDVLSGNERAISFYRKLGFVDTTHRTDVTFGDQKLSCLIMRKPLGHDRLPPLTSRRNNGIVFD